ncbi:MAG: thermonuclease family protein [Bauldia sp.]
MDRTRLRIVQTTVTALAVAASSVSAPAADIAGKASVTQGDMVTIAGTRIALFGVDAPDQDQDRECTIGASLYSCATNARKALEQLAGEGNFVCSDSGEKNAFGSAYMTCTVNGRDVGEALVAAGVAVAFRPQSAKYAAAEDKAKAAKLGLWQAGVKFTLPWEWRATLGRAQMGF